MTQQVAGAVKETVLESESVSETVSQLVSKPTSRSQDDTTGYRCSDGYSVGVSE